MAKPDTRAHGAPGRPKGSYSYFSSKFSKGNIGETPKKKFMSVASGQRLWHLKLPPEGGEALPSFAKQNSSRVRS